jgi:hypothetical protein
MPVKQQPQTQQTQHQTKRVEQTERMEHPEQVYCILCNQSILTIDKHHSCSIRKNNEKVVISRV